MSSRFEPDRAAHTLSDARSIPFREGLGLRTFTEVIWLLSPPWARWLASLLIAAVALWIEVRPDPTVSHPFAIEDIAPGTMVDESNTEERMVPIGTFDRVELGVPAREPIRGGSPILAGDVGEPDQMIPAGWWVIEMPVPRGAGTGDACRLVLLDDGEVVDGVVMTAAVDDPLGNEMGTIAVEPEPAPKVARAAAEGRIAVMIASS